MSRESSQLEQELYFLVARFLEAGPCKEAADALKRQLDDSGVLPTRTDWEGDEHLRSYEELKELYSHISGDHLLRVCQRIGPLLDKDVPSNVKGVRSLLGAGRQSILRTQKSVQHSKWSSTTLAACLQGKPIQPPNSLAYVPNMVDLCSARAMSGCSRTDHIGHPRTYSKMNLMSRTLGHLSAVYCVCYDRTGKYIFTGADDSLVKIWSAVSGRLLSTLRGPSAEITDMTVNYENTLLAAGSCDKTIRVWELRTTAPVAVLMGHTGSITSLQFSPFSRGDSRYLLSTGADGCVCYWESDVATNQFDPKPVKFIERSRAGAQMLCSSFSPGGVFLATGSSDSVVRVFCFTGSTPEKICELEAHTDRVDSIQYANHSQRFLSGSKDGTARIWRFERQEWRALVINVAQQLGNELATPPVTVDGKPFKYRVTMVSWSQDDRLVVTAVSDHTLKVWCSNTGALKHILKGHGDEAFVLEQNPADPRIMLSAGHDGHIIIWDIHEGAQIKSFFNNIEGQGHGAVFDCKWSPDGLSFVATDSHGYKLNYSFGSNERFKKLPEEIFFHTDYRPLMRDSNNYVLDEQTQQPPHLMPPAFLVDIDGNPHPPELQRLVPGRENCVKAQLIPQIGVTPSGDNEVLDDALEELVPADPEHANLDHMIQRLQREQDQRMGPPPQPAPVRREAAMSPPHARHPRRSGEMEGVRQASGNVLVSQRATESDIVAWRHRIVVKELSLSQAKACKDLRQHLAEEEIKAFVWQRRSKPLLSEQDSSDSNSYMHTRKKTKKSGSKRFAQNEERANNRLTTRALYDTDVEEEAEETPPNSDEGEQEEEINDKMWSSSSDGDSSDYSDWEEDAGLNMQPPTRMSMRQPKKRKLSSSEGEEEEEEDEEEPEYMDTDKEEEAKKAKSDKAKKKNLAKKLPSREKRERKKKALWAEHDNIQELPEEYRPPEWLTATVPRKAPYVPQMGDEVIYFRQGHQLYIHAVRRRKIYDVHPNKNHPWHKISKLRDQELVKVVGIKYEIRPPRLVCLKLAFIDPETSKLTGGSFSIKYHDMPDVIDFIVLRQTYDTAMKRKWKVGDHFRSMIDDAWWTGVIESEEPLQIEFPDSMFQCFNVRWDNTEREKMSPWDLEPLDRNRLPSDTAASVIVTEGEMKKMLYKPRDGEWPSCGRDAECERIIHCLERMMERSCAEHFLAPVDLSAFPVYAMTIEYPIDLSTIKERLENRCYRRVSSIMFDVRHIETNATKFNEPDSYIVKQAKFVTELCLRFIRDSDCQDIASLFTALTKEAEFARLPHGQDVDVDVEAGEGPSGHQGKKTGMRVSINAWKAKCRHLLDTMLECEDSEPFREPVNIVDYPEYYELIEHPIDLGTMHENLAGEGYEDPLAFSKDMHTLFHNSRTYNTNKRSKIYAMTLRLSAMFDDHVKDIIAEWKQAVRYHKNSGKWPSKSSKSSGAGTSKGSPPTNTPKGSVRSSHTTPSSGSSSQPGSSGYKKVNNHGSKSQVSKQSKALRNGRPTLPHTTRSGRTVKHKRFDMDSESRSERSASESDGSEVSDDEEIHREQKRQGPIRNAPRSKSTMNGHSKARYKTRNSTGAISRKKYDSAEEESLLPPELRVTSSHHNNTSSTLDTPLARVRKKRRYESDDDEPPPPSPSWTESKHKRRKRYEESSDEDEARVVIKRSKSKHSRKTFEDSSDDGKPSPPVKKSRSKKKAPPKRRGNKMPSVESEDESGSGTESSSSSEGADSDVSLARTTSDESASDASDSDEEVRRSGRSATRTSSKAAKSVKKQNKRTPKSKHSRRSNKDSSTPPSSGKSNASRTRYQGRRTVKYDEDSDDQDSEATIYDDDYQTSSVSSRGRVRRMTSRARASMFGDS